MYSPVSGPPARRCLMRTLAPWLGYRLERAVFPPFAGWNATHPTLHKRTQADPAMSCSLPLFLIGLHVGHATTAYTMMVAMMGRDLELAPKVVRSTANVSSIRHQLDGT